MLKICKVLAAGTTAPSGTLFDFTITGVTGTIRVSPGTCALLTNVAVGNPTIQETPPTGYGVSDIRFTAGTGTTNVAARSATATIVANQVTEVRFTNQAAAAAHAASRLSAPQNLTASPANAGADLFWSLPTSKGPRAGTGYYSD